MIENIIFDMGNVLIHFDPQKYVHRLGVSAREERLLLREVFSSVEWVQMDRGTLEDAAAVECFCRRLPAHLHDGIRKLVLEWNRPVVPVEGMYELIEELKAAGYGVYLLSNASLRHPQYWPEIPVSRFFDGILVSSSVGIMKPRQEIYQLLCERFGLLPETCFFVDDQPANVEQAQVCGIVGMVFHGDAGEVREKLRERGVKLR